MRLRFNIFNLWAPRTFHHEFIYVDERKQRLREIEEKARRELAGEAPEEATRSPLRGQFMQSVQAQRRRRKRSLRLVVLTVLGLLLLVLAILLLISVLAVC